MARTSNRRWKGCRLCRPHTHACNGHAARKSLAEQRQIGKRRRVYRHDLGDAADDGRRRYEMSIGLNESSAAPTVGTNP